MEVPRMPRDGHTDISIYGSKHPDMDTNCHMWIFFMSSTNVRAQHINDRIVPK